MLELFKTSTLQYSFPTRIFRDERNVNETETVSPSLVVPETLLTVIHCCLYTTITTTYTMPEDNLGYAQGLVPPPPGITPNFVDPVWNGIHLIVAAIVCPILAAIFVAARCASKTLSRGWGWDDCEYNSVLKTCVDSWRILLLTVMSFADQIVL